MSSRYLLLSLAQRHPRLILFNILFGFSGALFNGISTALIIPVLLNFLGQPVTTESAPLIIQFLLVPFQNVTSDYHLLLMAVIILLMVILKNAASYCNVLVAGALKRSTSNELRERGLSLLLEVDIEYHTNTGVGDIINHLNHEISRAASAIGILTRAFTVSITVLVFIGLLLSISWQLTIVTTGLLAIVAFVNQYSIARAKFLGKRLSETARNYSTAVLDLLLGMRLIRSVANEQAEYETVKQQIFNREQAEFQSQAISSLIEPISEVTGMIALLCIVFMSRIFLFEQVEAFSAVLLTYLFVLFRTLPLIAQLNGVRSQFANISPSLETVQEFLRRDNKSFMVNGSIGFKSLTEGIHFQQLSFTYPGQKRQVLDKVDLYIPRNTTLALVGASGAGKSTLVDLLPRFYDPTAGRILIDGQNLRELDYRTLRRSMGIVSQDIFLFNASVRENIAYGYPMATEEQILAAAQLANAYDFILQLPQGFDTVIGDRGVMLSGGQRQRIAIARALIQDPEILILDEATSALDTVSEHLVQAAIEHLSRDRTTLVIAHRLSTVKKADQIAVLDQGRVIELGSHDQLLAKNGYYARLCEMQLHGSNDKGSVQRRQIAQISYEVRSILNNLVGSLSLIMNGAFDNLAEHQEFTDEAYTSAIHLLKSLEMLEKSASESILEPTVTNAKPVEATIAASTKPIVSVRG